MTVNEFVAKWNGRYIDFDGFYGNQCMDLMHEFCMEVLGITDGSVLAAPCAKDVYNNFENLTGHEMFEKFANSPENVPNEGDIVLWNSTPYGHVAIFIEGDVNSFVSFDQNYPTGSPCHTQNHTYNGVLGWLRFKSIPAPTQAEIEELRAQLAQEIKNKNETYQELVETRTDRDGYKTQVDALLADINAIADSLKVNHDSSVVQGEVGRLIGVEDNLRTTQAELDEERVKTANLEIKVNDTTLLNTDLSARLQKATDDLKMVSDNLEDCKTAVNLKVIFKIGGIYICRK